MKTVIGACHHDCPDSCGWVVTVDETPAQSLQPAVPVAVKLRGNPAHPFSQGELCPKVNSFLERVYSPDRVLTPLRRTGPKGSRSFEPISWQDALDEIGTRLTTVIDRSGSESFMGLWDAGNQSVLAMHAHERFMHAVGASRMVDNVCGQAAGVGWATTYGSSEGADPMTIRHSKCVVLWGTNPRLTNRHLWPFIEEARSKGATVVCIDPLRTLTAAEADLFVQPLPGTDIALMLGLIHVWVRDGRVDTAYVADHSTGFNELAAEAAQWNPSRVANICGLDVEQVEELARVIADAPPAHFRSLIGAEHREHGAQFFRLLTALPVLLGSWRLLGGGASRSTGVFTKAVAEAVGLQNPPQRTTRSLSMNAMGRWLTDASLAPQVEALLVWNFNPLVSLPNAELIRQGLSREDLFTIVHEQFLTDTASYADIVLPATTQIEATDVVGSWGSFHVNWNEAAIAPLGESVSNTELFRRLAQAMRLDDPALQYSDDELLDRSLTGRHPRAKGITKTALRDAGTMRLTVDHDYMPHVNGGFANADGKAWLSSSVMQSAGLGAVVTYSPAVEGPHGEVASVFPLSLMTPKIHARFLNGSYAHLPSHGGKETGPWVELSPGDAAVRSINEGDSVEVFNDRASLLLTARIGHLVRDGVVAVPFGWNAAAHTDGRTANALTNDKPTSFGGGVAYSDTMVQVRRASSDPSSGQ